MDYTLHVKKRSYTKFISIDKIITINKKIEIFNYIGQFDSSVHMCRTSRFFTSILYENLHIEKQIYI